MARDNIGVITCPFTGGLSVVREDKRGKLYYYSNAGKITPNLAQGQAYLRDNMQPLTAFTVTEISAGAPPSVAPLTQQGAPVREKIPLTENEPPAKAPRKSILEEFGL